MLALAVVLVSTVSCGFAALIADRRDREPFWYAVGGALFGVLGVLVAAAAKTGATLDREHEERMQAARDGTLSPAAYAIESAKNRGRRIANRIGY